MDTTDTAGSAGTDRRSLLGYLAATATVPLGFAGLGAAGVGDGDDHDTDAACGHGVDGRLCTLPCGEHRRDTDDPSEWSTGAVTLYNCTDQLRTATVSATEGVCDERYLARGSSVPTTWTADLPPGERTTLWYAGSLTDLDLPHGSVNVAISQRDPDTSKCRPCD